jgi:hypothetical protein
MWSLLETVKAQVRLVGNCTAPHSLASRQLSLFQGDGCEAALVNKWSHAEPFTHTNTCIAPTIHTVPPTPLTYRHRKLHRA